MKKYIYFILLFSGFFFAFRKLSHTCFEKIDADRIYSNLTSSNSNFSYGYSHTERALYANHHSNASNGNNRPHSAAGYLASALLKVGYNSTFTFGPYKSLNNFAHKQYLLHIYPSHHFW